MRNTACDSCVRQGVWLTARNGSELKRWRAQGSASSQAGADHLPDDGKPVDVFASKGLPNASVRYTGV